MTYDVVIRNGHVVDGTGSPMRRADVAVAGGRIVEVGEVVGRARTTIDAEGHVVTPGFIDGHTHMDAQVMWDPLGSCSIYHGVTTVVMGNCGFTLAPARASARELVLRSLERSEDISASAMADGLPWNWETFPEYLDAVDGVPKAINYASQIGHSALRTWVMGAAAFERAATDEEIEQMRVELGRALDAGAIGFTTSQNARHETSDDRPVASRLATWDEIARLVDVEREHGGVFELALSLDAQSPDPAVRQAYLQSLEELAVSTRVTTSFGVLPNRPYYQDWLRCIDRGNARGARMFGQSHSRGISSVLSFHTRLAFDRIPVWREVRARSLEEQRRAFADPAVRARLVEAAHAADYRGFAGAEPRPPEYGMMYIFDQPLPPYRSVAEVAAERGVDPVELIIQLALESDFAQLFLQPFFPYQDEDITEVMRHPRCVMTFSDSGAHVSQIMDSSIQTHLLAHWVRQRGEFDLPEAVHMLTQVPAEVWGFTGRGVVLPGAHADLNVFDADLVGPAMPTVEHDLPAGAVRLKQLASGFSATIVGGQVVLRDGEDTGARPGRLLRRATRVGESISEETHT